jgi:hypothetical protein
MPEEYVIPLSIDVAGIIQNASQVKTSLSDVGKAASTASTEAKKGFDDAGKGAQNLSQNLVDNSQKYGQLTKSVQQLQIQLQSYKTVAQTSLDPNVIATYNKKVQDLQTQISQLSNQGKKGFDDLGNAVAKSSNYLTEGFSIIRKIAYILPGIGIAGILAFLTGPIIEWIKTVNDANNKLNEFQQTQKFTNDALNSGDYQKAISSVFELTENINLAKEGYLDKTKVLHEYNKELGSSLGYADSINEAEALLVQKGQDYIQITLLKAAAQLALGEASKKQLELAKIQLSNTDPNSANNDKNDQSGFANLSFFEKLQAAFAQNDKTTQDLLVKGKDKAIKTATDEVSGLKAQYDLLQKQAADLAKKSKIDFFDGTQDPDKQKKAFDTQTNFLNQLLKLQNEYTTAEIAGIEDETTRLVAQNDVKYQNQIRTLENQKALDKIELDNKKLTSDQYQTLLRQINLNIAQISAQGQEQDAKIIADGEAKKLKAQQDSIRAIGVLLKDETQARIDAVNANYDKVIAEAKKNGSLTTDYEKRLAQQRQSDISDVESKAILDRLTRENELQIAFIQSQGLRPGEYAATFTKEQQRALLANDLDFQKKRIAILAATLAINGSLTPEQTKEFADAIKKKNSDDIQAQKNKEEDDGNIFHALGINDDTQANIIKYGNAASQIGKITSDLFSSLAQGAENQVNAIQKQIDAINTLLQADQNAVDKQQSLYDKGRANSLDAAKKQLADDQAQKAALLKNQENAQKKAQELQKAQLVADTIAQTSNLITAATEIYKSVSVIPVIGPALAFAAVAAMFAGFAVAKVTAFNAVNGATQSAEEGGVAGGDRHSNGGNKYVSMDGKDRNILEIERGERIFSRKNSEKHKRLFEAIQNNDFSKLDISDVSIQDLLRGTGVMQQLEVARMTGSQNITLQDRANNIVVIANNSDKYLSSIDKKMDNLNKKEPVILDMGDYVWIDYGNGKTERRYK